MRLLVILAFVLSAASVAAQSDLPPNASGGPLHPEQAAYDVTHYDLDLAIDPETRRIDGTLTMEADVVIPTDAVRLDLDAPLEVEAVSLGETTRLQLSVGGQAPQTDQRTTYAAVPFERETHAIRVLLPRTMQPGERLMVRVDYAGAPRVAPNPPWVGGFSWEQTEDGRPWVAVSCQGEGADVWWPVKDHPSDEPDSMRIALTVPSDLIGVANGRPLGEIENGDGTTTFAYAVTTPINNYGVSFGVAPYEILEETYTSPLGYTMPVRFYVLPENVADAERQFPQFLDHVRFLEETLGPYAFRADGYNILHTPYLGMEHQALIAYGDTFEDNAFGFDWLHFHELAHEWFANLVTAPDWSQMWVHEGFAEYLEALYAEELAERRGEDGLAAYHAYLEPMQARISNARAVAPFEATDTHGVYFGENARRDADIYFKGAWILNTLRWTLGDEAFFEGLRAVVYPYGYEDVQRNQTCDCRWSTTEDVQRAFEEASGRDLSGFFAVYLRQPHLPRLEMEPGDIGEMRLRWVIPEGALAAGEVFDVPVEVAYGGIVERVEMPGGVGTMAVTSAEPVLDPNHWLLRAE